MQSFSLVQQVALDCLKISKWIYARCAIYLVLCYILELRASRSHEKRVQLGRGSCCGSSVGNSISPDDDGCVMNFSDLVLTALFLVPPISDVAND